MSAGRHWVLATGNRGKLAELRALLAVCRARPRASFPQTELGIAPAPEDGVTFVENALAESAARSSGAAVCRRSPTTRASSSTRSAASPECAPRGIAGESGRRSQERREAARRAALGGRRRARRPLSLRAGCARARPTTRRPLIASGEWQGRIAGQPRGSGGFGYDPIFVDPTTGQTAAELGPAAKNRVSHRGRALAALVTALRARWPASGSKSLG